MVTTSKVSKQCSKHVSPQDCNQSSPPSPQDNRSDDDVLPVSTSDLSRLEPGANLPLKGPLTRRLSCNDILTNGSSNGEHLFDDQSSSTSDASIPKCSGALVSDEVCGREAPNCSTAATGTGVKHRFVQNPSVPGGHEHFIESGRRREKLSKLWHGLFGKKQSARQPENDLSLVSDWVECLRQETKAGSHIGGHKAASSLIGKYGKGQEVLGQGAFGVVRVSHKSLDGGGEKLFAVKEFRRHPKETERGHYKRLAAEFCISSSLRHPNIIHTLDLLKSSNGNYCEVMEFCAAGDVTALILASGKLAVDEADCFFKQMMRGVEYLHEMGVAHRDLKPENLLLTKRGALKIGDFGNGECFRMAWEKNVRLVSGLCGSAPYISPEQYTDKEFDARAVDVWACGVIYMAMRTGRHLWRAANKDADELYGRYLEDRRDKAGYSPIETLHCVRVLLPLISFSEWRSSVSCQIRKRFHSNIYLQVQCRNVIYSVLDPYPTRRLTAIQVLKSEWVRSIQLCEAGEEGL
jgi:protein-serine/threonine kinase